MPLSSSPPASVQRLLCSLFAETPQSFPMPRFADALPIQNPVRCRSMPTQLDANACCSRPRRRLCQTQRPSYMLTVLCSLIIHAAMRVSPPSLSLSLMPLPVPLLSPLSPHSSLLTLLSSPHSLSFISSFFSLNCTCSRSRALLFSGTLWLASALCTRILCSR